LLAAKKKELDTVKIKISPKIATTVMLVAGGYPGEYEKGHSITGLDKVKEVIPFHAGTKSGKSGEVLSNGGRVLALTALGATMEEALQKSKAAAEQVTWKDRYYRKDIGFDLLQLKAEV